MKLFKYFVLYYKYFVRLKFARSYFRTLFCPKLKSPANLLAYNMSLMFIILKSRQISAPHNLVSMVKMAKVFERSLERGGALLIVELRNLRCKRKKMVQAKRKKCFLLRTRQLFSPPTFCQKQIQPPLCQAASNDRSKTEYFYSLKIYPPTFGRHLFSGIGKCFLLSYNSS